MTGLSTQMPAMGLAVEAQALRAKFPLMPLEHMLRVINDDRQPRARRDAMAKAAAPYLHQRLLTVEPRPNPPRHIFDLLERTPGLSVLSDEDLEDLIRIIGKVRDEYESMTHRPGSGARPRATRHD
jgi:hypothetical protein